MGLDGDQVNVLKRCFDGFADEEGAIPADNVGNILSMMGLKVKPTALKEIIEEIDEDGEQSSQNDHVRCRMSESAFSHPKDRVSSSLASSASWPPGSSLRRTRKP